MKALFLLAFLPLLLFAFEKEVNAFLDNMNLGALAPDLSQVTFIPAGFSPNSKDGKPLILKCLDGADITDEDCNIVSAPGTSQSVYYAFHSDIDSFAEVENTISELEDVILLTSAWTMKTDKYFHEIQVEVDQNSVQNEFMGEKGSGNFENKARIFVKTNKHKATGLASQLARRKTTWAIPLNDGTIAVIGSKEHPAYVKPMFDSLTDSATDPRGWEFQISSIDTQPWRLDPEVVIPLDTA